MAATDVGAGTTLTFSSGFAAEILSVELGGITREPVETTHSGTTTGKTYIPSAYYDNGELTVELNFDPDDEPPISSAAETVTVTCPIPSGGSTGATIAGSGFMTAFSASIPIEDRMTASFTIKFSGDLTWTDAT